MSRISYEHRQSDPIVIPKNFVRIHDMCNGVFFGHLAVVSSNFRYILEFASIWTGR